MLICVDFQPSYSSAFTGMRAALRERFVEAKEKNEQIHFIYNHCYSCDGELLGDDVDNVLKWGEEEGLHFCRKNLLKKNFGWIAHRFRTGKFRDIAIRLFRHLLETGKRDSSFVDEKDLAFIMSKTTRWTRKFRKDHPNHWEDISGGMIAIPMTWEFREGNSSSEEPIDGLRNWLTEVASHEINGGVEIIGGFRERCLDEIIIALDAAGINYSLNDNLIYSMQSEAEEIIISSTAITGDEIDLVTGVPGGDLEGTHGIEISEALSRQA